MIDGPIVSGLFLYPVKSMRGIACGSAVVEPRGLRGDRRWMVVDTAGCFLTQRSCPALAQIDARPSDAGLLLAAGAFPRQAVSRPPDASTTTAAVVWNDTVDVRDAGDEAAAWLCGALGRPCRLVYLPDASVRPVDPAYRRRPNDQVSLADGYPLLLTSEASLADLNRRLASPVPMARFRPNVVVRGVDAFTEDRWRRVRIGAVEFDVVKPCARCSVVTRDQQTGEAGLEPLRTLSGFRRDAGGKVYFGQNLIPATPGTVHAGDAVTVLETGTPRPALPGGE